MHKTPPSVAIVLAAAILGFAGTAAAAELRMMTGPQGGAWVPLGGQLKDMWEKSSHRPLGAVAAGRRHCQCARHRGGQDRHRLRQLDLDRRCGRRQGAVQQAARQRLQRRYALSAIFPGRRRADAGINSVKDLKGKAIAAQPRGNTAEEITKQLLQVNGLTYNDVKMSFVSYTDAVAQVQDGHAIAFTAGTTIPSSAVMDLASARDIKMLDLGDQIEAMKKVNPGYTLNTIPKGTYPKQDKDVQVIGYATHIVASCKLPPRTRSTA